MTPGVAMGEGGKVERYCEVADCFRLAVRSGLCRLHLYRLTEGTKPMAAPAPEPQTPYERTLSAAELHLEAGESRAREPKGKPTLAETAALRWREHLDAESDEAYHRTRVRLFKASRAWTVQVSELSTPDLFQELRRVAEEIAKRGRSPCAGCFVDGSRETVGAGVRGIREQLREMRRDLRDLRRLREEKRRRGPAAGNPVGPPDPPGQLSLFGGRGRK